MNLPVGAARPLHVFRESLPGRSWRRLLETLISSEAKMKNVFKAITIIACLLGTATAAQAGGRIFDDSLKDSPHYAPA